MASICTLDLNQTDRLGAFSPPEIYGFLKNQKEGLLPEYWNNVMVLLGLVSIHCDANPFEEGTT